MKSNEIKSYVVDVCSKVIVNTAKTHKIEEHQLNIRIDMENQFAKPIFGLFHHSAFLAKSDLKQIIKAGGGASPLSMVLSMYIQKIIKNIFVACLERFELKDTKDIFILLYAGKDDENKTPMLAIYRKGELMDSVEVGNIVGDIDDNTLT